MRRVELLTSALRTQRSAKLSYIPTADIINVYERTRQPPNFAKRKNCDIRIHAAFDTARSPAKLFTHKVYEITLPLEHRHLCQSPLAQCFLFNFPFIAILVG